MKLARFSSGDKPGYGVIDDDIIYAIDEGAFYRGGVPGDIKGDIKSGKGFKLKAVKLLAPAAPTKIIAIGLNYRAHAAEFNLDTPTEPLIFLKPATAVTGPGTDIVYPTGTSHRVDYEGELAVVINRKAKNVSVQDARDHILGYTCFNDVTARDLQKKDGQWARAKGFDTFAPMGPWIETELDPGDLKVETLLNGEVRQDSSTSDMIFNVFEVVSFISRVMTLLPGDVIATGTPPGVGKMKPGDRVEVRIDCIGALENRVVAGR